MLPAAHRLRRSADFAAAVRAGRRAGRGAVVVHLTVPVTATEHETAWQGDDPGHAVVVLGQVSQAGFVVSKAVGNAVTRNTVKRRLRQLTADRLGALPAGATVVVRALPQAASASYEQLGRDLDGALAAALKRDPGQASRRRSTGGKP
ncbi:ribonuclease P protein component [Catellatospora methionotrophica]|uniref:ribonuclease P protein component n=1 Tax=Catellatospora methionotrophica TaxID=121620 RepID=UPI00140B6B1A|nr:ribonuclease P protein component [Catellatospora methionotrophica]